ncbi:MAG: MlaD family protein, partial [Leptolyngbyaceae bacterium]|nr:MlaD family protein [Leptolyngbyaceae bacterium]
MRTRTVREGSAGLLILLGIGIFVGLGIWLRGFNLANRSYRAVVEFEKAEDIQIGTEVRFRGIGVGKVTKIQPGPNGVDVDIDLSPADL